MAPIAKKTYSRRKSLVDDERNINNSDPFDKLLSSPLKQNVDFKPLSFWRNKSSGNNHTEKSFKAYHHNVSDCSSIDSPNTRKLKELWLNMKSKTKKKVSKSASLKTRNKSGNPEICISEVPLNGSVSRAKTKAELRNDGNNAGENVEKSPEISLDHFQYITIKRSIDYDFSKGCLDVNNNISTRTTDTVPENCSTPGDKWNTYILNKEDEVSNKSLELQSGTLENYVNDEVFKKKRDRAINKKNESLNISCSISNLKTQVRSGEKEKLLKCDRKKESPINTTFYCDELNRLEEEKNFDSSISKFEKDAIDNYGDDDEDDAIVMESLCLHNLCREKMQCCHGRYSPLPECSTIMMNFSRSADDKSSFASSPACTIASCFSPILLESSCGSTTVLNNDSFDDVYETWTDSKSLDVIGGSNNGYSTNHNLTPSDHSLVLNSSFCGSELSLETKDANRLNDGEKSSFCNDFNTGLYEGKEISFQYADVEESPSRKISQLKSNLDVYKGDNDVLKNACSETKSNKSKERTPEFRIATSVYEPKSKELHCTEYQIEEGKKDKMKSKSGDASYFDQYSTEEVDQLEDRNEVFNGCQMAGMFNRTWNTKSAVDDTLCDIKGEAGRRNTVEHLYDGNRDIMRRKFFRCPRVKKQDGRLLTNIGSSKSSCTYSDQENDDSVGHGLKKEEEKRHSKEKSVVSTSQIKSLITGVSDLKLSCSNPVNNDKSILNEIPVDDNIISPVIKDSIVKDSSTMGLSKKDGKPVKSQLITVRTRRRDNKVSQNKLSMASDNRRVTRARDTLKSLGPPKFNSTMIGKMTNVPGSRVSLNVSRFSGVPNPIFESTRIGQYIQGDDHDGSAMSVLEKTTCPETSVVLIPGKKWQRSVSVLRQIQNDTQTSVLHSKNLKGRHYDTLVKELKQMQEEISDLGKTGIETVRNESCDMTVLGGSPETKLMPNEVTDGTLIRTPRRGTMMGHTVKIMDSVSFEKSSAFRTAMESQNNVTVLQGTVGRSLESSEDSVSARDVIMHQCDQTDVLPFEEYFNENTLKNCRKIGEGVFGEVFMTGDTVFKVIPIEGDQEVNGEPQKKFEEILSEVIIASKLSDLREDGDNQSPGFSKMKKCWCVVGKYPKFLLDLWNEYDSAGSGSENDSPQMFTPDQQYIVLELENGGKDLESFVFNSAEQSLAIFVQAAFTLSVAERVLEFEHRDLHWGNLLISRTTDKYMKVMLDGVKYELPTKGVKVAIIDFTLSRIRHEECCLFNDLSVDPTLFTSQGDYQFEIYRMMQREVGNDWSLFRPKTNIYWLHYILDKMLKMVRYKNKNTQVHKKYIKEIKVLESVVLEHESSADFVISMGLGV